MDVNVGLYTVAVAVVVAELKCGCGWCVVLGWAGLGWAGWGQKRLTIRSDQIRSDQTIHYPTIRRGLSSNQPMRCDAMPDIPGLINEKCVSLTAQRTDPRVKSISHRRKKISSPYTIIIACRRRWLISSVQNADRCFRFLKILPQISTATSTITPWNPLAATPFAAQKKRGTNVSTFFVMCLELANGITILWKNTWNIKHFALNYLRLLFF